MSEAELFREWQRGLLSTCVLATLAQGSAHGYAVAQHLQQAGIGPIKGGTLYPVLNRLETEGAVTSVWREGQGGPGRKVFEITHAGRERLARMKDEWAPFAAAVGALLGAPSCETPPAAAAPARD